MEIVHDRKQDEEQFRELAGRLGVHPQVADSVLNNGTPLPTRRTVDMQHHMVLKPNTKEVGSLLIASLCRGRRNCPQCGHEGPDGVAPEFLATWSNMIYPLNTTIMTTVEVGKRIAAARNAIMRKALMSGSRYVIMVDDDMILERPMFMRLYQLIKQNPEAGMIAAWSVSKTGPFREPFCYIDEDLAGGCWWGVVDLHRHYAEEIQRNQQALAEGRVLPPGSIVNEDDVPLVEITATGTGLVIIDTEWARKICDPPEEPCKVHQARYCWRCQERPWFYEGQERDEKTSCLRVWGQDIWFSNQIRHVGGKILLDPLMFVGHLERSTNTIYGPPVKRPVVGAEAAVAASSAPPGVCALIEAGDEQEAPHGQQCDAVAGEGGGQGEACGAGV